MVRSIAALSLLALFWCAHAGAQFQPPWRPPWQGGQRPAWPTQPPTTNQAPDYQLSWSIETSSPYVHQPILLRLRLSGDAQPTWIGLEPPRPGRVLLRRLQTELPRRAGDGTTINTLVFALLPLRPGQLDAGHLRVRGSHAGGPFEVASERPLRLRVRPPVPGLAPWLPARALTLTANLAPEGPVAPGEPLTLRLELSATGTSGEQLPTLADQLTGIDGIRVYRERAQVDTRLSPDGRQLLASRTETYTLVAQGAGRLLLPEIRVAWWNIARERGELARVPLRGLRVEDGSNPSLFAGHWHPAWMALSALLLVLAGYWWAVLTRAPGGRLAGVLERIRIPLLRLGDTLRIGLWSGLPGGWRLRLGLLRARTADTPEQWLARLAPALPDGGRRGRPEVVAALLATAPGADPDALTRLVARLEAARYGAQRVVFNRWQRALARRLANGRRQRARRTRQGAPRRLPPLNPPG
ncbi:BatD family protein [Marichromatium bheemlicum]|uniref:Protein BatD n=1 Tax=Marichromatium bheemlicum TaxID=365339 RepID=A0ABX1IC67_9GAMM|nr:BatD family protein [Marichromatium bheemlicum]NKN34624.1 protein BatD [Marichromatium bheemlicum]